MLQMYEYNINLKVGLQK